MPIAVNEMPDSPKVKTGQRPSAVRRYSVFGTVNYDEAIAAVGAQTPTLFDPYGNGLIYIVRDEIDLDPVPGDGQLWYATVTYEMVEPGAFHFEIGGGTQHIRRGIANVSNHARPSMAAINYRGLIGVKRTDKGLEIEGLDVDVGAFSWSETHQVSPTLVTNSYKSQMAKLVCGSHGRGTVNHADFKGFVRGEARLLSVSGSRRGGENWEINFRFMSIPNATNIVIPTYDDLGNAVNIVIPAKEGWHYVWLEDEEKEIDFGGQIKKVMLPVTVAAHVEQIFDYADYGLLGIGV